MFKPIEIHHCHKLDTRRETLSGSFGILCWNIHKQNHKQTDRLQQFIQQQYEEMIDILLFQEAAFNGEHSCTINKFSYEAAANLAMEGIYYGVLTASDVKVQASKAYLTHVQEGWWGTYKSLLLCEYAFEDGTPILVVNIHAINFREQQAFDAEKERLFAFLKNFKGALIVAGDFNAWSKLRQKKLFDIAERLGLTHVPVEREVKSFFGYPLDFVFYRGLKLIDYDVNRSHHISDHHPLFVYFEKNI